MRWFSNVSTKLRFEASCSVRAKPASVDRDRALSGIASLEWRPARILESLPIENTGSLGTTLLSHNLTLRSGPEPYLSRDVGFSEIPDSNDNISVRLGAKSQVNLAILRNEVIVYSMRHGSPMGSSIGPIVHDTGYLYGHFTYWTAFYVPTTRSFCFKYVPPNKGLPESWGVCSPDILARVDAAR